MPTPQLDNRQLGPDTGRANILVNGGFEIWQRGVGPYSGNGTWTADGWQISQGAGSTVSVARENTTADIGSWFSAKITYTHSNGSFLIQKFESANDTLQMRQRSWSLSFRVWCNAASAVRITATDGTNTWASAYHTGNSAWQTLTAVLQIPNANISYVALQLVATCTAYIDNCSMVPGEVPTDFVPTRFTDELTRCQRYYETLGGQGAGNLIMRCPYTSGAGQAFNQLLSFHVKKMATPTVTKFGTWNVSNCAQPAVSNACVDNFEMYSTSSAAGGGYLQATDTSCFITAESSP